MLRELKGVRQHPNERHRRWFEDDYFDLIVWYEGPRVYGFQLCYDTQGRERALTWVRGSGYSHKAIDDGQATASTHMTPILVQDGVFEKNLIAEKFKAAAGEIDAGITGLVCQVLERYPGPPAKTPR